MKISKMKRKNGNKTCPLLDRKCLKEECEIYHDDFKRCSINLLTYNLYTLQTVFKNPSIFSNGE